ncbi:adventurous gliding motility lipoprotein CglD [Archangium sp.]|uniref:adventurous gliding motility lipoprotein CglD n=1 Tax=Archangium sp. TaxID=1872627 RepID=UPI002D5C9F94|nr:adventurous gliding motility lipoprotein CglD [Archangium sp.]HYO60087.1 adventurous gliding motility lipoprotein CglD [Archangium sp.]
MSLRQLLSTTLLTMSLMVTTACPNPGGGPDPDPTDTGPTPLPTDPNDPNNAAKDTDCDGLSDKIEFEAVYDGLKTHPGLKDTDQDGLPDGLEVGVNKPVTGTSCSVPPDADASLQTSPVKADTDGDGLLDGVEDTNHNGKVDDDETHPLLVDTDCDGLRDGPPSGSVKGEDQNGDGTRESSETDPRRFDTDGDGISDGVESGATTNLDEANCKDIFRPDVNPGTTTDATNPDSDGDGVSDGAEDNNQNGGVDQGELDPKNGGDTSGPAGQVCTTSNLRLVIPHSEEVADLKLALPPTFTEVTQIKSGTEVKGLVGYDSTTKIAFLAFRTTPPTGATDPLGDEESLRPSIESKGALSNRTAQVFKTWEGFQAVQSFYDQAGSTTDLKRRTDQLVDALVPGSTGRLSSAAAGVTGNFRLQTLFVHRSPQSLVVLVAVAPLAGVTGSNRSTPAAFSVKDLSDGSALAQFGEPTAVQCERFSLPTAKVDFLFVVDDSGSMKTSQLSLAATAQSAVNALNASSLDWRMAMVTSAYHVGTASNTTNVLKLRRFTRNVNKVKAWLTENSNCSSGTCSVVPTTPEPATCPGDASQGVNGGCWVGLDGNGDEGVLGAARKAIDDMTPGTEPGATESDIMARKDATLVVVLLGDADDQTTGYTASAANCGTGGSKDKAGSDCVPVQTFVEFFGNRSEVVVPKNKTGKQITVHGIVCPSGKACGCSAGVTCTTTESSREFNPLPANGPQRHATVVNATGGVLGSILDTASIEASMDAIIDDAIGNAGYKTLKPPIGASIKVAMENVRNPAVCTKGNDIPRSTVNGFDFDGSARTLSFFGACRPSTDATQVAVSYQYWVDAVKDPNGGIPCEDDLNYSQTEPDHCSGPLLGCNETGDQCVCKPNCGDTCGAGARCNMTRCACEPILN